VGAPGGKLLTGPGGGGDGDGGLRAALGLPCLMTMRVLEARFRPAVESPVLIVGHLVWLGQPEEEAPIVRPAQSLMRVRSPGTFLSKLDYLISSRSPGCFERLRQLRSRFWSFVEVAPSAFKESP
jgi:hypothetical protein